ncbi:alpha/beta hydrolase family protein [Novipirellula artificiosorum]|uniref:Alpha/beta hydrolase family protein n=1 Tax=Novipirellula artificiosorum TaxID=2528016 RepID=A0A5C6DE60_9BACT|nr:dienelactone hydrolase [Novipirellula artificiosorum]TWU35042.1 Alpha/beta hydrolase family protein [Novipirellula artificiosorum]
MGVRMMLLAVVHLVCILSTDAAEYDPLGVPDSFQAETLDWTVRDEARSRDIPIKAYLPATRTSQPVVLFSHGLGGSREGCSYLGKHWSARGYVAVFLQHPGSDDSVWKDTSLLKRMSAMREAASAENFRLRVQDVSAVLDQLSRWNDLPSHKLEGRLDLEHVGMSGHSFGAQTTQAVSGQSAGVFGSRFAEPRIQAAIALSPSSPRRGDVAKAFGSVKIPWLVMTGTQDKAMIGNQTVASRLEVFPALPPGDKFELVLHNAEHSAFGDRRLPGETQTRNSNHHRVVLGLSTAFWDAYLRADDSAKQWLVGAGPSGLLQPNDRWQTK